MMIAAHLIISLDLFQYIDSALPPESPYLYGLHPNAEIGFLTQTSEKLFRTVLEMQPRDGGSGEGTAGSRDEKVLYSQHTAGNTYIRLRNAFPHYLVPFVIVRKGGGRH